MILAEKRSTKYKIIIAENAPLQHVHAAEELRTFPHRITGAPFPVFSEHEEALELRPEGHRNKLCPPERAIECLRAGILNPNKQ